MLAEPIHATGAWMSRDHLMLVMIIGIILWTALAVAITLCKKKRRGVTTTTKP